MRTGDQEKEVRQLRSRIEELEASKEKLCIKIAKLRDEKDMASSEVCQTRTSSDQTVNALSHELRCTKQDLEKTASREKQLLDFRSEIHNSSKILLLLLLLLFEKNNIIITITISSDLKISITILLLLSIT